MHLSLHLDRPQHTLECSRQIRLHPRAPRIGFIVQPRLRLHIHLEAHGGQPIARLQNPHRVFDALVFLHHVIQLTR